jgi:hypothetical protein
MEFRRMEGGLAVSDPAQQLLSIGRAARALGQQIDPGRQLAK